MLIRWGSAFFILHSLLAMGVFLTVQFSHDGQAGFLWFFFHRIDYPVISFGYWLIGDMEWMLDLVDYWYTVGYGQGPNIRAFIIVSLFGGIYWLLLGVIFCFVFSYLRNNLSGQIRNRK